MGIRRPGRKAVKLPGNDTIEHRGRGAFANLPQSLYVPAGSAHRELPGLCAVVIVGTSVLAGIRVEQQHGCALAPEQSRDPRQQPIQDQLQLRSTEQQPVDLRERLQGGELALELGGHGIEGARKVSELVVPRQLRQCLEVSMRDPFRGLPQQSERSQLAPDGRQRQPGNQQDRGHDQPTQIEIRTVVCAEQRRSCARGDNPPRGRSKPPGEEHLPRATCPAVGALPPVQEIYGDVFGSRVGEHAVAIVKHPQRRVFSKIGRVAPEPLGIEAHIQPSAAAQRSDEIHITMPVAVAAPEKYRRTALQRSRLPLVGRRHAVARGRGWLDPYLSVNPAEPRHARPGVLIRVVGLSNDHQVIVRDTQAGDDRHAEGPDEVVEAALLRPAQLG